MVKRANDATSIIAGKERESSAIVAGVLRPESKCHVHLKKNKTKQETLMHHVISVALAHEQDRKRAHHGIAFLFSRCTPLLVAMLVRYVISGCYVHVKQIYIYIHTQHQRPVLCNVCQMEEIH